jgi:hypothetical protein
MRKHFNILILFILTFCSIHGQTLITPTLIETEGKLKSIIADSIIETRTIDFDGDSKSDFICSAIKDDIITDYWLTSNYIFVKKQCHYDAYYKFWFIQLDNDKELEVFYAWGYPEGIDYWFSDINYNSKEETDILYFNPVILDSTRSKIAYWGYAWDIQDIYGKNGKILCSTNHGINDDGGETTHPNWQSILPIVFFKGKSTQPDMTVEDFSNPEYLKINELINKVRK